MNDYRTFLKLYCKSIPVLRKIVVSIFVLLMQIENAASHFDRDSEAKKTTVSESAYCAVLLEPIVLAPKINDIVVDPKWQTLVDKTIEFAKYSSSDADRVAASAMLRELSIIIGATGYFRPLLSESTVDRGGLPLDQAIRRVSKKWDREQISLANEVSRLSLELAKTHVNSHSIAKGLIIFSWQIQIPQSAWKVSSKFLENIITLWNQVYNMYSLVPFNSYERLHEVEGVGFMQTSGVPIFSESEARSIVHTLRKNQEKIHALKVDPNIFGLAYIRKHVQNIDLGHILSENVVQRIWDFINRELRVFTKNIPPPEGYKWTVTVGAIFFGEDGHSIFTKIHSDPGSFQFFHKIIGPGPEFENFVRVLAPGDTLIFNNRERVQEQRRGGNWWAKGTTPAMAGVFHRSAAVKYDLRLSVAFSVSLVAVD